MGKRVLGVLLIVLLLLPVSNLNVEAASDEGTEVSKRVKKQQELEKTKSEITETKKEIEKVLKEVDKISKKTEELKEKEEEIKTEIRVLKDDIKEINEDIIELEQKIEVRNEIIEERMKSLQEHGGTVNYLDVLLGAKSFTDFIDGATSVKTIHDADQDILRGQQEDLDRVETEKEKISKKVKEMGDKKEELEDKIKEGKKNKKKKQKLVTKLETKWSEKMEEKDSLEKEIERLIIEEQESFYEASSDDGCRVSGGINKKEYKKMFKDAGALTGKGNLVKKVAEKNDIDPVLMASIVLHETGYGTSKAVKVYNNPGGMMSPASNWSKLIKYDTLEEGLQSMAETLDRIIKKEKKNTIAKIGSVYAPIGAENDPTGLNDHWVKNVEDLVKKMGGTVKCKEVKSKDGWVVPAKGRLTSEFGWRTHPIQKIKKQHRGTDIANKTGTKIVAARDGVVSDARTIGGFGNVVIITHKVDGKPMTTLYAHLSSMGVKKGEKVKAGQEIAKMGSTGNSTGPHLHFEVHEGYFSFKGDSAVNPKKYVKLQ